MYQTIHEEIAVIGLFKKGKFIPRKFQWQNQVFPISQITLISKVKDGGVKKRLYSVISKSNTYRLEYNLETEIWMLEEIWVE